MKKIIVLCLSLLLCLSLVSCSQSNNYCRIDGMDFYFVSDSDKEEWREPLIKLLSNVAEPYGEHGEIMGYRAPDPNAPSIPRPFACGLFDVTGDGIAELLLMPLGSGGSSGSVLYEIYDIQTGTQIGHMSGGGCELWCAYYNKTNGKIEYFGEYVTQEGYSTQIRHLDKSEYDDDRGMYISTEYIYEKYVFEGKMTNIEDEDPEDGIYSAEWNEYCKSATYQINGKETTIHDYLSEHSHFQTDYIRIPETALVTIKWNDVTEEGDDHATEGRKMADALIGRCQQVLVDYS